MKEMLEGQRNSSVLDSLAEKSFTLITFFEIRPEKLLLQMHLALITNTKRVYNEEIHACIFIMRRDNRSTSKCTACLNDINVLTAVDAFGKEILNSHLTLLLRSNFVNVMLTAEYAPVYAEPVEKQIEWRA